MRTEHGGKENVKGSVLDEGSELGENTLMREPWKEAEDAIRREYPNVAIQVLPENSRVSKDVRPDRVRVVVKGDGKVAQPPHIG